MNKNFFYQPVLSIAEWEAQDKLPSFGVYREYENAKKEWPNSTIGIFTKGDIEDPTFMDELPITTTVLSEELEDDPAFVLIKQAEDVITRNIVGATSLEHIELLADLRHFINDRRKHTIVCDSWRVIDIEYSDSPKGFWREQKGISYTDKGGTENLYSCYLAQDLDDPKPEDLAFLKKIERAADHYGAFYFRIINTPKG